MRNNNITIVISTYKREKQLLEILTSLNKQLIPNLIVEIIICDSGSNYNYNNFPELNKNLKLIKLDIEENVLSIKRNIGILNASYSNIILLDDDCIPCKDFLVSYLEDFEFLDDYTIISGIVKYPANYIENSKYIKFRDSKHFKNNILNEDNSLSSNQIVAMNMGFKKTTDFINSGLFDKRFYGYGFEDYEFAYRYKKKNYKLKITKASIIHDEGKPNLEKYLNKYYHLGRDGMKNLLNINEQAAKDTIYYRIENNFYFKMILKIFGINKLLIYFEKMILLIDKIKYLNIPKIYEFARLSSYVRGFLDRNQSSLTSKSRNWYE